MRTLLALLALAAIAAGAEPSREQLMKQAQMLEQEIAGMRAELRKVTGLVDASPEALHPLVARLEQEQISVELEAATAVARREALTEQIARLEEEIARKVKIDPVAEALAKVLLAREEQVKQIALMLQQGTAGREAFLRAEAELVETQVRIIEARRQAAMEGGGAVVNQLKTELIHQAIEQRVREKRAEVASTVLRKLAEGMPLLDGIRQRQMQLEAIHRHLEATR